MCSRSSNSVSICCRFGIWSSWKPGLAMVECGRHTRTLGAASLICRYWCEEPTTGSSKKKTRWRLARRVSTCCGRWKTKSHRRWENTMIDVDMKAPGSIVTMRRGRSPEGGDQDSFHLESNARMTFQFEVQVHFVASSTSVSSC